MRVIVAYESLFGNTRRVAETIASVLQVDHEVTLTPAVDVRAEMLTRSDLLVLGAPTHAHGLPSPSSRESAAKQGIGMRRAATTGVRELLETLPSGHGKLAAVFDTRLRGPHWMWGAASPSMARGLQRAGFRLLLPPEGFLIRGVKSPHVLANGELERAAAWGVQVARAAAESRVPTASV
jgi:hypothetical protein